MATDQIKFSRFHGVFMNSHDPDAQGHRVTQVQVTRVSGGPANALAYVYQCFMVEDNDGAPNCYGLNSDDTEVKANPKDPDLRLFDGRTNRDFDGDDLQRRLTPLERSPTQFSGLANASQNRSLMPGPPIWSSLFAANRDQARAHGFLLDVRPRLGSTSGKFPVVKRDGPFAGFYISTTTRPAPGGSPNEWDQSHWLNAAEVPYAVWADRWGDSNSGVGLGDSGLAINTNTGAFSEFKFLDGGTPNHVGECSRKLCRTLVPTPDTTAHVPNTDPISFIVFPNSRSGGGVSQGITNLAAADNSDELVLFLALGADLDEFGGWLLAFYNAVDYHGVRLPPKYYTFMMALAAKGYPVDQIPFHAVERSINVR
jgi:hypothetical protein